uniref:Fibroin light chain n=1 Tax=Hydropsyche angustipennis TaxID=329908 RepID=A5A6G6_9NEOP|nr:fibroin light chain [Hydropsyche angustipennis]BAH80183.1 fibroin light chain [Hydropsyche angustipennis]
MAILVFLSALLFIQAASAHCNTAGLVQATWGLIEDGEIEPFSLVLRDSILAIENDNPTSQLYALGATLTAVSELSWVRPSSACAYANLINANVGLANHNLGRAALSSAIDGYAQVLAQAAENIRILGQCCVLPSPWPVLDNCCGDYGRIYDFENSWSLATGCNSEGPRCAARDLYLALNARSNNVGAAATSAATTPALSIFKRIKGEISSLLSLATAPKSSGCATRKKDLRTAAGVLKQAIYNAADDVKSSLYSSCV